MEIQEIYLSVFVVFFRAASGDWSDSMNRWKGVLGVTLVELALIVILDIWILFFTGINLLTAVGKLGFNSLLILSFALNYYVLVMRGAGARYQHKLATLNTSRRRFSIVVGNVVTAVVIGLLILSFYVANPHRGN